MGEAATGLADTNGSSARVRALGAETTAVREHLDDLVAELGRRKEEVLDWRSQVRRHRGVLTAVLGGVVAVVAASLTADWVRQRRRATFAGCAGEVTDKIERLGHALARMLEDPDRLARIADRPRRNWATVPAASALLTAGRMLLPHVAAALTARGDRIADRPEYRREPEPQRRPQAWRSPR